MFRNLLWCRINSVGPKMKLRKNEEITAGKVSSQVCHWMNRGYRVYVPEKPFQPLFQPILLLCNNRKSENWLQGQIGNFTVLPPFGCWFMLKWFEATPQKKCTTADRPPICWSLRSLLPQASWRREPFLPSYRLVRGVWKKSVEDVARLPSLTWRSSSSKTSNWYLVYYEVGYCFWL